MYDYMTRWRKSRKLTLAMIAKVPDSALQFRPKDEYRTIRDQILHFFSAEIATTRGLDSGKFPWREVDAELEPLSIAQLIARGESADDELEKLLSARDAKWLDEMPAGSDLPRREWLEQLFEHEVHHRGILSLTIRLAGAEPARMYG